MNEDYKMVLTYQRLPIELTIKQIWLCLSILIALIILFFNIGVKAGGGLSVSPLAQVEAGRMANRLEIGAASMFADVGSIPTPQPSIIDIAKSQIGIRYVKVGGNNSVRPEIGGIPRTGEQKNRAVGSSNEKTKPAREIHPPFPQPSIINIAKSQLGNGEIGGNNKGKWVKEYNRGLEAPWCTGFISWCLNKAKITDMGYTLGARQLFSRAVALNLQVSEPQAGDLIFFWRGKKSGWQGHCGVVTAVGEGWITTIEANRGKYPAVVKEFLYEGKPKRLLGYIRLAKTSNMKHKATITR